MHVEQGPDSKPVTRQEQLPSLRVPYGDRKLAIQMSNAVRTIRFIGVQHRFGITVGCKLMAARFQITAELWEVENLTVEDDPQASVFVSDRLLPTRQVDDAQPGAGHSSLAVTVDPGLIWPAMMQGRNHPRQQPPRGW